MTILLFSSVSIPLHAQSVPPVLPRVLISELQTESDLSANEEFVEITNTTGTSLSLDGWVLQYRSATGTSWQDKVILSGTLYKDGSIVVSSQGYNVDHSTFFWSSTGGQLAATGGNIRLIPANSVLPEDTLAWGTGVSGETAAAIKAAKGKTLHRKTVDGILQDTDNNSADFIEDFPDPINRNEQTASDDVTEDSPSTVLPEDPLNNDTAPTEPEPDPIEQPNENQLQDPPIETPPIDNSLTDPTEPPEEPDVPTPPVDIRSILLPPVINELMINPSAPLLDSDDEWIELYNPNSEPYQLEDFKIQTGTSYSYSYTFTDQVIEPKGYLVLNSEETNLALSNTSGAVRLLNDNGKVLGNTVTYEEVEEGNAYALASDNSWRWTITPTSGSVNQITEAPIIIKTSAPTFSKTAAPKTITTKKSAAKKASAKTTATKASTKVSGTKPKLHSASSVSTTLEQQTQQSQKSRPLLLATFVVMAVLYGLYEYRDDVSNSMWKARRHLEAWRKNRQSL